MDSYKRNEGGYYCTRITAYTGIQKKNRCCKKYGGNAMINEELKEAVMHDLVLLSTVGIKVVLFTAAGPEINKALDAMQIEKQIC